MPMAKKDLLQAMQQEGMYYRNMFAFFAERGNLPVSGQRHFYRAISSFESIRQNFGYYETADINLSLFASQLWLSSAAADVKMHKNLVKKYEALPDKTEDYRNMCDRIKEKLSSSLDIYSIATHMEQNNAALLAYRFSRELVRS